MRTEMHANKDCNQQQSRNGPGGPCPCPRTPEVAGAWRCFAPASNFGSSSPRDMTLLAGGLTSCGATDGAPGSVRASKILIVPGEIFEMGIERRLQGVEPMHVSDEVLQPLAGKHVSMRTGSMATP